MMEGCKCSEDKECVFPFGDLSASAQYAGHSQGQKWKIHLSKDVSTNTRNLGLKSHCCFCDVSLQFFTPRSQSGPSQECVAMATGSIGEPLGITQNPHLCLFLSLLPFSLSLSLFFICKWKAVPE